MANKAEIAANNAGKFGGLRVMTSPPTLQFDLDVGERIEGG